MKEEAKEILTIEGQDEEEQKDSSSNERSDSDEVFRATNTAENRQQTTEDAKAGGEQEEFWLSSNVENFEHLCLRVNKAFSSYLQKSDIVANYKEKYLKYLSNMQTILKQGRKLFEKEAKLLSEEMITELKKVADEESRLEYLQHLKQPDEKGSTKKRLGLLF